MGRWWSLVLIGAILLVPIVRADPAISIAGPDEGLVSWRFSNPANYTASDVVLGPMGGSLAWLSLSHRDTTRTDFSLASSLTNIDLLRSAGRVLLANTSQQGPVQNLTFQPDAASMRDPFIYSGNVNQNFGNAAQLFVGNWTTGTWTRPIPQFPALPLPANATIVSARLELYYNFVINDTPMDVSVHRVTSNWTEFGSTWNRRDGITPWNGAGGDFDPAVVATVAGITNVTGWYGLDGPLVERDGSRGFECHDPFPDRRLGPGRRHLESLECAAPDFRDAHRSSADALPPVRARPLHPVGHVAERAGRDRDVFEVYGLRVRHDGGIRTGSAPGLGPTHDQRDDPDGHRHLVGVLPRQRIILAPRVRWRGSLGFPRPGHPPSDHPRDERHARDTSSGKRHPPLPHRLEWPRESCGSLGARR